MLEEISSKNNIIQPQELYKKKQEKQPRVQQQQFRNQIKKLSSRNKSQQKCQDMLQIKMLRDKSQPVINN